MKRSLLIIIICVFSISITYGQHRASRLKVTANGHYLQYEDDTPFFWLGDTGWDLFHKLKLNDIKDYPDNRAAKGVNVIQALALAEPDGIRELNRYGQVPLKNLDPTQPDNQYFLLIDSIGKFGFHRKVAGVLAFDYLSSNYGMTGDCFFDKIKDLTPGSTLKWFKYCFTPPAVFIDLGDQKILRLKFFHNQVKRPCYSYRGSFFEKLLSHFFYDFKKNIFYLTAVKKKKGDQRYRKGLKAYNLGDDLVFNLIGVNYDSVTVKGSVNLYWLDAEDHLVSSRISMKTPLFLTALLPVRHKLPEKRRGYLFARAYTRKGNKEPVILSRYIKFGTINSYQI